MFVIVLAEVDRWQLLTVSWQVARASCKLKVVIWNNNQFNNQLD